MSQAACTTKYVADDLFPATNSVEETCRGVMDDALLTPHTVNGCVEVAAVLGIALTLRPAADDAESIAAALAEELQKLARRIVRKV